MPDGINHEVISFTLNGTEVEAVSGETIWDVAQHSGVEIPHLCHSAEPGYRPDGNCRTCMVEVEGERVLVPSCLRQPTAGMKVSTNNARATKAREMVFELLLTDQPDRSVAHNPESKFWNWTETVGITKSRFPKRIKISPDSSHPAMRVNLDACIQCNLCVRACREVQVNDVIGMAFRGHKSKIVFDFDDSMGDSTCVACGECVQACPTGALMESSLLDDRGIRTEFPDRSVDTLCPFCGVGCQTTAHVKGDKIISVTGRNGPANEQRLCVKGRFGYDYVEHPNRLTTPLIRRDDAPKKWDIRIDDADVLKYFRKASWDEALVRAADGFKEMLSDAGPSALAGFGSAKGSNEEAYLFQKLVRTGFRTNNVDHCTRLCHASSVTALLQSVGSAAVSAPFTTVDESDCIIVIGARPDQNHPVAATYLKQAAKRETKLIIIDPRKQSLSRHADWHLQFKPGQDVALLNAMLYTIISEGLCDTHYIKENTVGFQNLQEKVEGFSPENMADVCGISASDIRKVARCYATSKSSIIFWGMGVSQHVHGTDNSLCLINLALITGQIGRSGTGLHPLRGQNNVQGASDAGLIPMSYPDYASVEAEGVRQTMEEFWGLALDPAKGRTVVEIVDDILAGSIRAMYVQGENPAMSDPDQGHARRALAKLDHLVVQDIFLTETAWFADVILPASAHAEKSGTYTNTNRQVQIGRPVVPSPGSAKQDWWLIQEIAKRMGLQWNYAGPEDVFGEMKHVMSSLDNITWERLNREGVVTYPCVDENHSGNEILFDEGFPTENGRGKIIPAGLVPPDELPDLEYPMVLTTGRLLEHWHTGAMTRRASTLDALEPEAIVGVSRRDLDALDIAPGELVSIKTRRGSITLKSRLDREVPEGMLFVPFCFSEAAANILN